MQANKNVDPNGVIPEGYYGIDCMLKELNVEYDEEDLETFCEPITREDDTIHLSEFARLLGLRLDSKNYNANDINLNKYDLDLKSKQPMFEKYKPFDIDHANTMINSLSKLLNDKSMSLLNALENGINVKVTKEISRKDFVNVVIFLNDSSIDSVGTWNNENINRL